MKEFRIYSNMAGKYRVEQRRKKYVWSWLRKAGPLSTIFEFDTLEEAHLYINANFGSPPIGEIWEVVHEVSLD